MLTLAAVIAAHGKELFDTLGAKLLGFQKQALFSFRHCRTPYLGGHIVECPECGHREHRYASCQKRGCPQCEGSKEAKWLLERESELLPTHYFHVVFTVPHELNELFLHNPRQCYGILFQAAAKTLQTVAENRLGGHLGFFSVLHTWGQKLDLHPHIHCVIPGGVILPDGSWKPTSKRRRYFLPHKVLADVFKGILLKKLRSAYRRSKLKYSGDLESLLAKAATSRWVVHAQPPFGSALAVLKYLSRYTRKVAISNSRLVSLQDGVVTFSIKDYADQAAKKLCALKAVEFLRRFLLHIPPPGFVRIRHYGFMAGKNRVSRLAAIRDAILGLLPDLTTAQAKTDHSFRPNLCQACGLAFLLAVQILAPQRADSS